MKLHQLKLVNPYFEDVWSGLKDFEVRYNDRDFKVGDRLMLIEHGEDKKYQPRHLYKDIKYILYGGQYGISQDYVILGLKDAK